MHGGFLAVIHTNGLYSVHQRLEDLVFIHTNGLWSMHGGLLAVILWEPNMIVINLNLREVSLWMEFQGLLLEFQIPHVARKLAPLVG